MIKKLLLVLCVNALVMMDVNSALANSYSNLPDGIVGISYNQVFQCSSNYSFYIQNPTWVFTTNPQYLRSGLVASLGKGGVVVTGSPTNAAEDTIRVAWYDSKNYSMDNIYINVRVLPASVLPKITSIFNLPLPHCAVGKQYLWTLDFATSGTPLPTLSVSPSQINGMSLAISGNSLQISGTPTVSGMVSFSVTAKNGYSPADTRSINMSIEQTDTPITDTTVPVTEIVLVQDELTVNRGDALALTAIIVPANASNQTITWSSSNPSVVTVNDGLITGVATGSATISVLTQDGNYTADCIVTVEVFDNNDNGDNGSNTKSSGGGGCNAISWYVLSLIVTISVFKRK